VRCAVLMHFSAWSAVRIRIAIETITADMLQTVWNELDYRVDVCRITKGCTYRGPVRYVTKTWSVVLLNKKKKYIYSYLKCIVYDKLLKPRQSFRIILYITNKFVCQPSLPNMTLLIRMSINNKPQTTQ